MKKRVCFFAPVRDRAVLDRVEFYRQDLEALRQLDIDLHIATSWRDLSRPADLYYIWWWNRAFQPLIAARWFRKPALITGVFDLQNPLPGLGYHTRPYWQRQLIRWSAKQADLNVFVSVMEHGDCGRELGLTNSAYVPLGVDTSLYVPGVQDAPAANEPPFLLTVAWLQSNNALRKGMHTIVRAMPALLHERPDLRVVMVGEHGTAVPELLTLARELGVAHAIDLPGAVALHRKIALMQRCAAYLQPSRFEGFGLAILEAMSCGAAVVTSPVGGVPEVVGDTALFADHHLPGEIAAATLAILRSPELRATLGRKARARAESEYPLARRQQGIAALVERLLTAAPASASTHAVHPDR